MTSLLLQIWPWLLVAGVVLLTLGLGRVLLPDEQPPYEKQPSLVSPSEHALYRALVDAGQQRWTICPAVRLADVLRVRPQTFKAQSWQSRIGGQRLDFVLCDPANFEAKLAVLHEAPAAVEVKAPADEDFLSTALAAAQLPLLRVAPAPQYNAEELRAAIHQLLGIVPAGPKS